MKRVFRELAILNERGEDLSHIAKVASEICYKNMKIKADPAYLNINQNNKKERGN